MNGVPASGVSIVFSQVAYTVTFGETGPPSGASWSVTLNGTVLSSGINSITLSAETNGTYGFSVGEVPGYVAAPAAGSVPVRWASYAQKITFSSIHPPRTR